jgi:hypothetical protein
MVLTISLWLYSKSNLRKLKSVSKMFKISNLHSTTSKKNNPAPV